MKLRSTSGIASLVLLSALLALACIINPATGKRQISLVSESEEIRIGQDTDRAIVDQMGLYGGDALQDYVQEIGQRMADISERPHLDWTFRVVDDSTVNAFALPGGYIYVTRGIMAYLASEAELATVIGHEIGHVTARHSADQMTKAQLASAGLMLGTALGPDWARGLSDYAQAGAGLLKLHLDQGREDTLVGYRVMKPGKLSSRQLKKRSAPGAVFDLPAHDFRGTTKKKLGSCCIFPIRGPPTLTWTIQRRIIPHD